MSFCRAEPPGRSVISLTRQRRNASIMIRRCRRRRKLDITPCKIDALRRIGQGGGVGEHLWCVMTTADASIPLPAAGAVKFLGKEPAYWRLRIKGAALLVAHARHLSLLVCHRRAPLSVVEHRDRRRDAGIYRARHRAPRRLSARHRHPRAALHRDRVSGAGARHRGGGDRGGRLSCSWCCSASSRCTGRAATGSPARCFAACVSISTARPGAMRSMRCCGGRSSSSRSGSLIRGRRRACNVSRCATPATAILPAASPDRDRRCSCAACRSGSLVVGPIVVRFRGARPHGRLGRAQCA